MERFFFSPSSLFSPLLDLSPGMGSIPSRCFFSYHSFSFLPFLFPSTCISFFPSFFCPPLISSSHFPLAFLPFFYLLFFSHSFSFFLLLVSPFLLLFILSFLPLFSFLDFFPLFLSSLFLILFVFVFVFLPLNFFHVSPLYQGGCYEHKG